jgi:hypothetical protein
MPSARSARKHWAGLTVITQDAADVLGSDLGKAVVANAATQVLLRRHRRYWTRSPKRSGCRTGNGPS